MKNIGGTPVRAIAKAFLGERLLFFAEIFVAYFYGLWYIYSE